MSKQPIIRREHIPELQVVRALAITGVLAVHASAAATIAMKESAYYFFYNFVNTFMRFGTPTFILLSSFVLFYSYYDRPLDRKLVTAFYKKRLLYIIVPYILFSVIYFVYIRVKFNLPLWEREVLFEFLDKLMMGEVYSHLYFIFISIQFYLLFPILLWVVKRWKGVAYALVPVGFLLQWVFVLFNQYEWQISNKGSWSLSYFSFFFTGAALGIFYPKVKGWLAMTRDNARPSRLVLWIVLWATWLTLALAHVMIYYNARVYGTRYHALLYEFLWNFHTFFTALVLLNAAFFIYRHMPRPLSKVLYRMGQLSFGIYLVHLLWLFAYDTYVPHVGAMWVEHVRYFGSWLFMLAASWLTVALFARYVPFSWMLFGTIQKKESPDKRQLRGSSVHE